jgi:hypothetical protein
VGLLHKTFGGLAPDTKILVCCAPAVVIGTGVALTVRALTIGRPVLRTLGMVAVSYPVGKAGEKVTEWMWKELHPTAPTP